MSAVSVRGLTKRFGDFTALDRLALDVPEGKIFGLLGPNGAGKTTLIKILCGLMLPTAGEALIKGGVATEYAQQIGYMPQESALYVDMTARENMDFFAGLYGLGGEGLRRREDILLALVGMSEWGDRLVSEYSGGMKHRVSLACALVHSPTLLFLDEPTVGIDPELRAEFWRHFKGLSGRGVTVLITTHYLDEARHCDDIAFLLRGRCIAHGGPRQILERTGTDNLEDAFLALTRGGGRGR